MGDWAHRFGVSPLMRMTASWSWSAWTDRIQVRGAMLRPWAGSPRSVVADPTRCALSWRSDRTRWRQETGEEALDRKSPIQAPYKFADQVQIRATRLKRLSQS